MIMENVANQVLFNKFSKLKNSNKTKHNTTDSLMNKVVKLVHKSHDDLLTSYFDKAIDELKLCDKGSMIANLIEENEVADNTEPETIKRNNKWLKFLNKSVTVCDYVYRDNPMKTLVRDDLNYLIDALLHCLNSYDTLNFASRVYDIYKARDDDTLTDTTYVVVNQQQISRIENALFRYEYFFLIPSGIDTHELEEYSWTCKLFKMGIHISSDNYQEYSKKACSIIDLINDRTGNAIGLKTDELKFSNTTLKRRKDILFDTGLQFAEYVLYEKY